MGNGSSSPKKTDKKTEDWVNVHSEEGLNDEKDEGFQIVFSEKGLGVGSAPIGDYEIMRKEADDQNKFREAEIVRKDKEEFDMRDTLVIAEQTPSPLPSPPPSTKNLLIVGVKSSKLETKELPSERSGSI
jgi:hypothetical protein